MAKRIAFLRGINVGGHNVAMERLRALIAELGLDDVETFIASGNVIFDSGGRARGALEKAIEEQLEANLGYGVATFVRTPSHLAAVIDEDPFADLEGTTYAVFLKSAPDLAATEALAALEGERDRLHVVDDNILWWTAGGMMDSGIQGDAIGKALGGVATTTRNMSTVRKLALKYPA